MSAMAEQQICLTPRLFVHLGCELLEMQNELLPAQETMS